MMLDQSARISEGENHGILETFDDYSPDMMTDKPQGGDLFSIQNFESNKFQKENHASTEQIKPQNHQANAANNLRMSDNGSEVSISPDANKKITNIVVFYSDNSFQSFSPS